MNAAILLVTSAWLAGADCGTPACGAPCDTCCEVKEKKSFFKKKKKSDTCDTCETTYVAPATCGCEADCGGKKEGCFSKMFKRKKKKCDDCDTYSSFDSCGSDGSYGGGGGGAIQVIPSTGPETVPLPKGDPKDKPKSQAPQAPGNNFTPTSSPKPLELGSSPY